MSAGWVVQGWVSDAGLSVAGLVGMCHAPAGSEDRHHCGRNAGGHTCPSTAVARRRCTASGAFAVAVRQCRDQVNHAGMQWAGLGCGRHLPPPSGEGVCGGFQARSARGLLLATAHCSCWQSRCGHRLVDEAGRLLLYSKTTKTTVGRARLNARGPGRAPAAPPQRRLPLSLRHACHRDRVAGNRTLVAATLSLVHCIHAGFVRL